MSRAGDGLGRLATRICSERNRRRLIDPAIADLQSEFETARRARSRWLALRALAAGYLSVAKVLLIAICGDIRYAATTWTPGEAASARRGALLALAVTAAGTPLFTGHIFGDLGLAQYQYLVPSALPLSVPLGLAIASAWMLHAAVRTRKVAAALLITGGLTSAAMFVNLEWVVPDANQAFRARVMATLDPSAATPSRGANELRSAEVRERMLERRNSGHESEARWLELTYHRRWSMSATPIAMMALMVAVAFRRRWTRRSLAGVAFGLYLAHYALVMSAFTLAQLGVARPIVLAWAGNVLCAVIAVLITWPPSRARA